MILLVIIVVLLLLWFLSLLPAAEPVRPYSGWLAFLTVLAIFLSLHLVRF